MSYVVNITNHLNNLYVLSNKAVGPGKKNPKLINVGPTSIPEARVIISCKIQRRRTVQKSGAGINMEGIIYPHVWNRVK